MNGAIFDSSYNVFFKLKHSKLHDSVLATRMGPRDIAVGEIAWSLLRGTVYSAAFLVVASLAGAVSSPWALLALPASTLIAFAFAAVGMFLTTFMRSWVDFDYITLAIQPRFLFSATFFPLATYPGPVQWVVQVTPLFHGVALERGLMLGEISPGLLWHVGYLLPSASSSSSATDGGSKSSSCPDGRRVAPASNACSVVFSTRSSARVP
jgi:lipooligosaccharide transport system permease protein